MSVVAEQTPAATGTPAETPKSLSSVLYDPAPVEQADTSDVKQDEPAQKQDTEPASAKADATPPADAKEEPVAKADEKDPVKEQLANQTAAARRLGKEKAELQATVDKVLKQNEELIARLNGTWKEPPKPSADQVAREADFRGREKAARPLAEQDFGAEEVEKAIYAGKDAPFNVLTDKKPWLLVEVSEHPQPPVAAMKILRREAFIEKYGDDPRKWEEKIIEGAKAKLFEEFKAQLETQPVGKDVPTVSTARNAGGANSAAREKSMADIIYDGK